MPSAGRDLDAITDLEIRDAVAAAHNWNQLGVLIGICESRLSGAARGKLVKRVKSIGIETHHFNAGNTRLVERRALEAAIAEADTWEEVAEALGFKSRWSVERLQALAAEHGIDVRQVRTSQFALPGGADKTLVELQPTSSQHHVVALMLTAAWFASRGIECHIAAEGCKYDLIADDAGALQRVQVKSTLAKSGSIHVACNDSSGGSNRKRPYTTQEVDLFALFTPEGAFLVPARHVAGKMAVGVKRLESFRISVDNLHFKGHDENNAPPRSRLNKVDKSLGRRVI